MATEDEPQLSLMSLEDDLTCSICLNTFDCPVTIPCGHNFCRSCLDASWSHGTYSCPQCRSPFSTKPELKKNTVLSSVANTFSLKSSGSDVNSCGVEEQQEEDEEEEEEEEKSIIRCDTCMLAEAYRTCLTCMASFCEEHLRPHQDNPVFRPHQLSEPVSDLLSRICPDHHKLMELFCTAHARPICNFCLQQQHKGCPFSFPEEQRRIKETDLRAKLDLLDKKISNNQACISQMSDMQDKLLDSVTNRKKALSAEYQQMRDMLTQQENDALDTVDQEMQTGQTKIRTLTKKFTENMGNMGRAKEEIHKLLSRSQTLDFLQVSVNLPAATNFDPYCPRISLDSKTVVANQAFSGALKQHLSEIYKHPVEARLQLLIPGLSNIVSEPAHFRSPSSQSPEPDSQPRSRRGKKSSQGQSEPRAPRPPSSHRPGPGSHSEPGSHPSAGTKKKPQKTPNIPPQVPSAEKRSDLLKYGRVLYFDPDSTHKRISLSENNTKATVLEEQVNYPDCPQRFTVCSQVLATSGFSQGRHYWEVRLSCNNFIGIGLALGSMDRKGPNSRLGRNGQSCCVEWFNVKLSAWHRGTETVLENPSPKRVGVLLDCDTGTATFYKVADTAQPFHSCRVPVSEPVFPAFWIFSSGSSISLCTV